MCILCVCPSCGPKNRAIWKCHRYKLPAFQWYITAKDPAVLQLDGLGCGLQLGGQSSRRGRTLVPSIRQGVSIERGDGRMMLCRVLLMGRWQRLQGGLALVVRRLLWKEKRNLYLYMHIYRYTHLCTLLLSWGSATDELEQELHVNP